MARVLFTKKIDKDYASSFLGDRFIVDCEDFISTEALHATPFSLENKSLIFTSVNAINHFLASGFEIQKNPVYCVGEKTRAVLEAHGFGVSLCKRNALELAMSLENKKTEHFVHFCADIALSTIGEHLRNFGIDYQKVEIYQTLLLYPKITHTFDALVFFSPSGVRSFAKFNSFSDAKIFSIGETTARELKRYTNKKPFISKENSLKDLLNLIKREL